jgi:uncharacterized protein YbbC (DUF1343 family)
VYPGTCLIEGTNVSEGRGTTRPFELIGAPWVNAYRLAEAMNALKLPGVRFRPVFFTPTFGKYQGESCAGIQLHVYDRLALRPVAVGVHLIQILRQLHPKHFAWQPPRKPEDRWPIDLLAGSDTLRRQIEANVPADEIMATWEPGLREFAVRRQPYLLY